MLTLTTFEQRYPVLNTIFGTVGDWLHDRGIARDRAAQLKSLTGEQELTRVARGLGMSRQELGVAMALSPGFVTLLARRTALPLARRLATLGIDRNELRTTNAPLVEHLSARCVGCAHHARCEADLDRDPDDRAWQGYCPNAKTLDSLQPA
jgi:hypothetical protein